MVNIFGDHGGGKEGEKGSRGERGPVGPAGGTGPPGAKGDVGKEGDRGPRGAQGVDVPAGKQGERGPSGIEELCAWLPAFILHEFRNTESCSYFFPTNGSGFEKTGDVINELISHSTHPIMLEKPVDAIAVKASSTTIPVPNRKDRLALQFADKMLYKASGLKLSLPSHAWVCLCVTFRVRVLHTISGLSAVHQVKVIDNFEV